MLFTLLFSSCAKDPPAQQEPGYWERFEPVEPEYAAQSLPYASDWTGSPLAVDTVKNIPECSGMVCSRKYPGLAWVINDSGQDPELILLDLSDGRVRCRFRDPLWFNTDWEELAYYREPGMDSAMLLVADIGDNLNKRQNISLYLLREPDFLPEYEGKQITMNLSVEEKIVYYPDGPRDAEALFVDETRGDVFIISKQDARARIYALPKTDSRTAFESLVYCGSLPITYVNAMDYHAESRRLVIRNYTDIYTWTWEPGSDIRQVMGEVPERLPYGSIELQGESIALSPDGNRYYLLGEAVFNIYPVLFYCDKY